MLIVLDTKTSFGQLTESTLEIIGKTSQINAEAFPVYPEIANKPVRKKKLGSSRQDAGRGSSRPLVLGYKTKCDLDMCGWHGP